jgi:hypothetical protein
VTQRGWREHFVKGILEDDLPFSLGEKAGMINQTLPLYKQMEKHLETHRKHVPKKWRVYGLPQALQAGLEKLRHHMNKALESDYPLLGAGKCSYCLG